MRGVKGTGWTVSREYGKPGSVCRGCGKTPTLKPLEDCPVQHIKFYKKWKKHMRLYMRTYRPKIIDAKPEEKP